MSGDGDLRGDRREYGFSELTRALMPDDPLEQFRVWMQQAMDSGLEDATAMALATSGKAGVPSVRIVLLKHFDRDGFCWYTDYRSDKSVDIEENPVASAVLYWHPVSRQVRITGSVSKLDAQTSAAYFLTRPLESRLSAAASTQSAVIADRRALENRVADLKQQYPQGDVPPPDEWGGYRLVPDTYEFWQGRAGRLHDRFRYQRTGESWRIERLQP